MTLKILAFLNPAAIRLGLMAISFGAALSWGTLAIAQTTPCDPQYMDALESRAYLEAQREIAMNQNLIVKPDSVLEYTCFDQIMGTIAGADDLFSESTRWGDIPNHGDTSLDEAFDEVVSTALASYINTNFGHTFLGGRSTEDVDGPNNVVDTAGGGYPCDRMLAVWNEARCMNFFNRPQDRFHDFQFLSLGNDADTGQGDPRALPTYCPNNGITAEWINRAFNGAADAQRYVLQAENPMDNNPYVADPMVTHLNRINPYGVAPATACAGPVPTGVIVFRQGGTPAYYNEKVCPNPGCYYVPTGAGATAAAPSDAGACQP